MILLPRCRKVYLIHSQHLNSMVKYNTNLLPTMTVLKHFSTHLLILIIGFLLAIAVSQVFAAFSEPTAAPPGNNASEPLNVSGTGQAKAGGLILNTGGASVGLIVDQGTVGIGTVTPDLAVKLEVVGGTTKTTGGLIIETRTSDPASPEVGRVWLRTDL